MAGTLDYFNIISTLEAEFDEVNGFDFYKFLFPNNENLGELNSDFSKPNALFLYKDSELTDTKRRLRRRIMLTDSWESDFMEFVEKNPMTLCNGIAYRGRANKLANAQRMHALVFDLDGVGLTELKNLFLRFGKNSEHLRTLPMPTFLVVSGGGLHIYYVFDTPVDLYPNIKLQMQRLKYNLTFRLWEYKATSQQKAIQYQSINQGFRMVGSVNNKYGVDVRAFKVGEKVSLEYINQYVNEKFRLDIHRPFKPSKMSLETAKTTYPEWYQKVIVEKNKNFKKWQVNEAVYDWWLTKAEQIKGGHRYFYLMCLVIYAVKCDVQKKELKQDLNKVFELLKNVEHTNELTKEDIESALEAYDKGYYNYTIADIEKLTDIRIERNKRNGRKQGLHLKLARANLEVLRTEGSVQVGRKSDFLTVQNYILSNPNAKKCEILRATGLSKPTVYKHYNAIKEI